MTNKTLQMTRLGSFDSGKGFTMTPFKSWNIPYIWMVFVTKTRDLMEQLEERRKEEIKENKVSKDESSIRLQEHYSVVAKTAEEAAIAGYEAYQRNRHGTPQPKRELYETEEDQDCEDQESDEGI